LANSGDLIPTVGGGRPESTPVRNCLEDLFSPDSFSKFWLPWGSREGEVEIFSLGLRLFVLLLSRKRRLAKLVAHQAGLEPGFNFIWTCENAADIYVQSGDTYNSDGAYK
jgi:hypothetical protein